MKTSGGLVYGMQYNTKHRITEQRIGDGADIGGGVPHTGSYLVTDLDLVSVTTYGDYHLTLRPNEREYLIKSIERVTPEGHIALPTNDLLVETTNLSYGFYGSSSTGADIAWIQADVEQERDTENGPATSTAYYSSYQLFDENGLSIWSRSADNVLTRRTYQADTGAVASVTLNADKTGDLVSPFPSTGGLVTTSWDRFDANTTDLTTTLTRDRLGRLIETVRPGGVTTSIVRRLESWDERDSNFPFYSVVTLPHILDDDKPTGPARMAWLDAEDNSIGSVGYALASYTGTDLREDYIEAPTTYIDLATTANYLTQSSITHTFSGLAATTTVWHDVEGDDSYDRLYAFDGLGRPITVDQPNGTQRTYEYDVRDRVIASKIGLTSKPNDLVTTTESFYDSNGTATQGTGDGNLTLVRQHVDGTVGEQRDTEYVYDDRNRQVLTVNPVEPHSLYVYDNLDRTTEMLLFQGSATGVETLGDVSHSSPSDRGRYIRTAYSQRGLPYRTEIAIDPNASATTSGFEFLESNTWYDEVGRAVVEREPGSTATKTTYDALGRASRIAITDAKGDEAGTYAAQIYAAYAAKDTDDHVFQEIEYSYINGGTMDSLGRGQVDLVTILRRRHTDGEGTAGALTTSAMPMYAGYYYDDANRLVRVVNYGTNSSSGFVDQATGTAPTITQSASPPDASSTSNELIWEIAYNERGLVESRVDPDDVESKYFFDDKNRTIAMVESYVDATVEWNGTLDRWEGSDLNDDSDRLTSFIYNGVDDVVQRIAHLPDGSGGDTVQVTEYVYDVQQSGSTPPKLYTANLVSEVRYPDESAGTPGTTDQYKVTYEYNRQGEILTVEDQNGTIHAFDWDTLGRLEADSVTTFGSYEVTGPSDTRSVDNWADAIEYVYDGFSRLDTVRTKSSSTVLNAIQYDYDSLWNVTAMHQNPVGDIGTDHQTVAFTYTNTHAAVGGVDNYSRLASIAYPWQQITAERTKIEPKYGTATELDDRISRLTGLAWNVGDLTSGGTAHDHDLSFVGLGMAVEADCPDGSLLCSRYVEPGFDAVNGADATPGQYPGLDRFGRLQRQVVGLTTSGTWDPDLVPAMADFAYAYDNASNILSRQDARQDASLADRDEFYSYDTLHRLTEARRGVLSSGSITAVNAKKTSQLWNLDTLGNWNEFNTEVNGDGSYSIANDLLETRSHNSANEITILDPSASDPPTAPSDFYHDDAGNLVRQDLGSNAIYRILTYDAWNRLVQVEYAGTGSMIDIRATYTYLGLHQRATSLLDTDQDAPNLTPDELTYFFYDPSWRLLERRVNDSYASTWSAGTIGWDDLDPSGQGSGVDPSVDQYIWGTQYIDQLLYWQHDGDGDGDFTDGSNDRRYYAVLDRNFSVIGLKRDTSSEFEERVRYTPYGQAQAFPKADINNDGSASTSDLTTLLGQLGKSIGDGTYIAEADLNHDGSITTTDLTIYLGASGISIPASALSALNSIVGYNGYLYEQATGLYCVRNRWYDADTGRWISRDPLEYVDGTNLYQYVGSNALGFVDPYGLETRVEEVPGWKDGQKGTYVHTYKFGWFYTREHVSTEFIPDVAQGQRTAADDTLDELLAQRRRAMRQINNAAANTVKTVNTVGTAAMVVVVVATPGPDDIVLGSILLKNGVRCFRVKRKVDKARKAIKNKLPRLDNTGKLHGDLPHIEDLKQLDKNTLKDFRDDLRDSLKRRKDVSRDRGPDPPHSRRETMEQDLLRSIDKFLGD